MRLVLSSLEMAELDRRTIEDLGVPARTLMEVAGRAVADYCAARLAAGATVAVACGAGNNGGDGMVAARALAERGYRVTAFVFGEREGVKADARAALHTLEKSGAADVRFVHDA
ncbi:MAG: bifunctional ADP-dependent NAD(P)H-hydrate dehydratase/NAD(P)H-hydrate epimerase, partial [Deltaproteobacteria bacterium]|nr:bifunctional ADP-dependent NAD(P)H-hydrate dehydratase/NAD(P)H-hydrate epimerase [Deltaproteobacteria bacterium]